MLICDFQVDVEEVSYSFGFHEAREPLWKVCS